MALFWLCEDVFRRKRAADSAPLPSGGESVVVDFANETAAEADLIPGEGALLDAEAELLEV